MSSREKGYVVRLAQRPRDNIRGHSRCEFIVATFCIDKEITTAPDGFKPTFLDKRVCDIIGVTLRRFQQLLYGSDIKEPLVLPFEL